MQVVFSNRVEKLYENLKASLYSRRGDPFARRLIVVSNQAVKSWLMMTMAKDPDLGISAGTEITYLDKAIEKLASQQKIPSKIELALAIEIELKDALSGHEDIWELLKAYLKVKEGKITRKGERRLISLADSLAQLFIQYGLYGAKMIADWESKKISHWQTELWNRIHKKYQWSYRSNILKNAIPHQEIPYEVHLFSLGFLSKSHFDFFSKVQDVCLYLLSPCQSFWSDLATAKRQIEMEDETNFLLSNLGRLGKEMAKLVEDSSADTLTEYVLPESALELYNDLIFDDFEVEKSPFTLLKAVQSDILLLRNPQTSPKIELPNDDSIQIHVASCRKREVEILYDSLLPVLQEHAPKDVIVMVPNLADYEPYIHSIFRNSRIPYQMLDSKLLFRCPLAQAFLHLLKLPLGRWDSASLVQLFRFESFKNHHRLTDEDIQWWEDVLIEVGIRWGNDEDHRDLLLLRDHGFGTSVKTQAGTWSHGLNRILAALAVSGSQNVEESNSLDFLPSEQVEASQAILLGRFISLIDSLKDDLACLADGSKMSCTAWCDYLKCLLEAYLGVNEQTSQGSEEARSLWIWLDQLRRAGKSFKERQFTFDTVKRHLETGLQKEDLNVQESQLNAVCFCSMLPLRSIPAKMICLMGMEEGAFPRSENKQSYNLLTGRSDADYCPTQMDYDRYLFLEAILSARDCLYISYIGFDASGAKEKPPSLVVSELLSYINTGYVLKTPLVRKHPFYAFDKSYYQNGALKSYSKANFDRAKAFYAVEKEKPHRFVPEFVVPEERILKEAHSQIDIKQLAACARNPFKTYFNKTLGIYLSEEEELKTEEEFVLSNLDLSYLKKTALGISIDSVILQADKKGMLPPGPFRELAVRKVHEEAKLLQSNLISCGVNPQEIFKIHLADRVESPQQDENGDWHLPSLDIDGVKIVGTLQEVSEKGLIFHGKDDKTDVLKVWPQFLVFHCARERFQLPIASGLVFAKSGKIKFPWFSDATPFLKKYLDYYFYAHQHISPFLPEWTHDLMHVDTQALRKKIQDSLSNDFNPIYNDYLLWLAEGKDVVISETWKTYAIDLFSELYSSWYAKKGGV